MFYTDPVEEPGPEHDRLEKLERTLEENHRRSRRLCWIQWNPDSKYGYTIEDAREDVRWMIYEIKRLKTENQELLSFAERYRQTIMDNTPDGKDS